MSNVVVASGRPFASTGVPLARSVLRVGLLAAAYYGAAKLEYSYGLAGPVAAIVWLPAGIAIAFLYVGGLQLWPGVLIGDLLANNYSALPVGVALVQTVGNLAEVVLAVVLLRRWLRRSSAMDSVAGVVAVLAAIAAGTAVSASVGALSVLVAGLIDSEAVPRVWRTWWLGDTAGALVVVPLALAWCRPPLPGMLRERGVEGSLVLLGVAVLSEVSSRSTTPLTYLAFPFLIWAALRFGLRGASLAVAIVVAVTVWNTTHYQGPFVYHSITRSVLSTQLFIAVAAVSTLCLAAAVCEREEFAARLGSFRGRLIDAADTERRRIERNIHDGAQQRLVALAMRMQLTSEQTVDLPGADRAFLEDASGQLLLAIGELRDLAHGTHPVVLTELGLADAIRSIAARSSVPVTLLALPAVRLDPAAEATAYYVVAEAVANAQKHALASSVRVRLGVRRRTLLVEVSDDGAGGASETPGSGLQGMRDRIEQAGGWMELSSAAGRGTRVTASIPFAGRQP